MIRHLAFGCFLACLTLAKPLQAQVEFRGIGGPGDEFGEVVVPDASGAYLVSTSKQAEDDMLRGYIVRFNAQLDLEWSVLLPEGPLLETPVDAWSDMPGILEVLTFQLGDDATYRPVVHRLDSAGHWLGSTSPAGTEGLRPACGVVWQGERWMVGTLGSRPTAVALASGEWMQWGGTNGVTDEVNDATVSNGLLVSVGARTAQDSTSMAVWAMYPLGQQAFSLIRPDAVAHEDGRANAVATGPNGIRVLHTYRTETDTTEDVLHSLVSINAGSGEVNGALYGPSSGQRPGRDLVFAEDGWVKITQTDAFPALGQSILVTHYAPNGTYVSQGAFGTPFEDDPSRAAIAEDGAIWVAGSTRGILDGSWSACVLRLDSIGPLGQWSGEAPGFGVYNDPLYSTTGIQQSFSAESSGWRCAPNPASHSTRLMGDHPESPANWQWVLLDPSGKEVSEGRGDIVDLENAQPGRHTVVISVRGGTVAIPLMVGPSRL